MKKSNFLLILMLSFLFQATCFGQQLWSPLRNNSINKVMLRDRQTNPKTYQLFTLDFVQFKQLIASAPKDSDNLASTTVVQFPNGDGELSDFRVYEAPIMESGLMEKFPNLKSYTAIGVQNPQIQLRFSITDFGLHVMSVTNTKSSYFIDSYSKDNLSYIVYYKKDCTTTTPFSCSAEIPQGTINNNKMSTQSMLSNDGVYRQYRMAMTASSDFSQFHIDAAGVTSGTLAQQKSAVLSALTVIMTRVNGVFERDLGVHMNLVANNDLIILIGPDSFQFTEANLLNENIDLLNTTIGFDNYDLGHLVMTIGYNMGVPALCHFDKGAGTTGSYTPVGDSFVIDYLAHEIGHQFGAGHSFYSSCGGNVDEAVCVEPGSGSTIMGYAGNCAPTVQNHADAYFTTANILQMQAFINEPEQSCATTMPSGSAAPIILPLNNYTIPLGTAFVLKGVATAPNQNLLTYCWEQIDTDFYYDDPEQPQPPLNTNISGPNFRSLPPSFSPDRYMPNFGRVLAGNLYPKWEVISNVARTMNFALTVRDNNIINGGQTQTATTEITVANVGPFKITSLNAVNASYPTGTDHNLTWDVAGTTANGINTATVTILLSTDNGVTFTTLVSNTPNDGNEDIQFPNIFSPYCRIMITADQNIYYAVSPNFSLGYDIATTCSTYTNNQSIPLTYNNGGYTDISINVPSPGIVSDVNLHTLINHSFFNQCEIYLSSPANPTNFVHINNGLCYGLDGTLDLVFDDEGSEINCDLGSGTLQNVLPYESLYAFNGQEQQGNWTLRVKDTWDGDDGEIVNWGLEICSEVAALSLQDNNTLDFSVYPNPNNGVFIVQFQATSNQNIEIDFFDIQGRKVINKIYISNTSFKESINIAQLESGVYFISASNGVTKKIKKIVIQ